MEEAKETTFSRREFQELLSSDSFVNVEKLREASRHGIPSAVRSAVWTILLGVVTPNTSEDMALSKKMSKDFLKRIEDTKGLDVVTRNKVHKLAIEVVTELPSLVTHGYSHGHHSYKDDRVRFSDSLEKVLLAFALQQQESSNGGAAAGPSITRGHALLAIPLVHSVSSAATAYHCYKNLAEMIEQSLCGSHLKHVVSTLLMLFRHFDSELYAYFEDEELTPNLWAVDWISYLLADSLPLKCVLRLWDSYLSLKDGLQLHIYVCIAVLLNCKEELVELEYSELRGFLHNLPALNMDQIIQHALNLFDDAVAMNLLGSTAKPSAFK